MQYPEVFDQDITNDVGVWILYGAKAFLIFDQEVSKDESLKEVHGNMEEQVKAVPGISIDGKENDTQILSIDSWKGSVAVE